MSELIDTCWNVNKSVYIIIEHMKIELIDTCWNVNSIGTSLALIFSTELIDTCWDVNINITLSEKSINEN